MTIEAVGAAISGLGGKAWMYTWSHVLKNTSSGVVQVPGKRGTFHVKGTFGATVTFEGSNDGVTYVTLKDLNGTAMSYTAEALVNVAELPAWVRLSVSNAGSPDIVAMLCVMN